MTKAFNALYENGVFKPVGKVRLKNKQKVRLALVTTENPVTRGAKSTRKRRAKSVRASAGSHAAQIVGLFKSGVRDLAEHHDHYLYR
jgi:predicted DNA-binding antitoxin AbrB/MazE fold protein